MGYQKLEVWRQSCQLSINVYKTLANLKDYGFKDQITRSALSVPSNIAEGLERDGDKEKVRFLKIAKGSMAEFNTQTYIGMEAGYIPRKEAHQWIIKSREISAMLGGLIKTIQHRSEHQ